MKWWKLLLIIFSVTGTVISLFLYPFSQGWALFICFVSWTWGFTGWFIIRAFEKWYKDNVEEKENYQN